MSPNPEAMASIPQSNRIKYLPDTKHIDEGFVDRRPYSEATPVQRRTSPTTNTDRSCDKHGTNSHLANVRIIIPKKVYKLTEDSYRKLRSYCGHKAADTVCCMRDDDQIFNGLAKALERVEECPWYWGNLSGQDSIKILAGTCPGTFLLRLSSDPKYLFSLSVKTKYGPTSIRIVYESGHFRFDSELTDAQRQARDSNANRDTANSRKGHPNYVHRITKKFTCVIHLILYYTKHLLQTDGELGITESGTGQDQDTAVVSRGDKPGELFMCYWLTRSGRREIPVLLSTPLLKQKLCPSLQNICRAALSKEYELWKPSSCEAVIRKDLPTSLRRFLAQYPYPI